jgi:hypothetical protein
MGGEIGGKREIFARKASPFILCINTLRQCLVSIKYKMQNTNYFEIMKYKMPKISGMCLVSFKMPNFSWGG